MPHRELKFSKNNGQADLEFKNYEEVFHPMIEFLRHHYICPALTMDYDVPMEYIQEAYHSAEYSRAEDKIEFIVQCSTYTTLTKNLLQTFLELPTRNYHKAPTLKQITKMLKEIGYVGHISSLHEFRRLNLPCIWGFLFSILNRCITGKTGSTDKGGKRLFSIMWGLVKVKDIDFIHFIWEDFVATVTQKKKVVPYSRFWAIIIKKVLGSDVTLTGELPPKFVSGKFKLPIIQERCSMKEEMLALIPDNSPVLKKYRELKFTSEPEQTFQGSRPRRTKSGYHQGKYSELFSDSSGEDLPLVLSTASQDIENTEASIPHPQDTFVESMLFIEPAEETPVSFDHYARIGVIPPSVDLTKMPNKHVRFDDSSDIELDPRNVSTSDHSVAAAALRQKKRCARNVFKNILCRRDLERQRQGFEGGISRKEFDEMKANVQEVMGSVKDLVQLNLENRIRLDDIKKSWEITEGRRIAEYASLKKEIKGLEVYQTSFNKTLEDKVSVVERSLNAISTKVDALQQEEAIIPTTPLMMQLKYATSEVGGGTSASQPSGVKRASAVLISELEPKRSKTSHDEQQSNGKGKKKSLANEDLSLPEIEDLDTTNNIVDETQQFHEELQKSKEDFDAEFKLTSEPTQREAVKEKVVQNLDTSKNIAGQMQQFDEELQESKEGIGAEFKSTSEPILGEALKEKVVQNLDITKNIIDEMQQFDEELQKSKDRIDAEFKLTSEATPGGSVKEQVVPRRSPRTRN